MPTVALFEPNPYGHRLEFVKEIVLAVSSLGIQPVWITTAEAVGSDEYRMILEPLRDRFECKVVRLPESPQDTAGFRKMAGAIAVLPELDDQEFVYIPTGNGIAQILGLMSRRPTGGKLRELLSRCEILVLGGQFGYPRGTVRSIRNRFSAWSMNASAWGTIFHLDPLQYAYLSRGGRSAWQLMPDPVATQPARDRDSARSNLGLPTGGTCLASTGWIGRDKGADVLMDAFEMAVAKGQMPEDAFLYLAGRFENGLLAAAQARHGDLIRDGRMIFRDELLPENVFQDVLQALDILCLPYQRAYQSSGIFLHGVANRKPVLVNQAGWLERNVRLLGNGWMTQVENVEAFSDQLVYAAIDGGKSLDLNSGRIGRFLKFHSIGNFRATWTRRLRRSMGLLPDPNEVTWASVTG